MVRSLAGMEDITHLILPDFDRKTVDNGLRCAMLCQTKLPINMYVMLV